MSALERRTVSSLALLYSFRMLGLFMVLPVLALYAADYPGATPAMIGLALGAYGLSQALLQIPLGWLSDRVGRKPVIIGGLVVFALGSVMAALADSVWGIVLGRCLQGAGAIASTVMALVADLTSPEQRTKAMAMVGMSIGFSFAVALVLGPVVAASGGLPAVFWLTALLAAVGVVIVLALVPTPEPGLKHSEVGTNTGLIGSSLKDPNLARLNFGIFVLHFCLMACFLVIPGQLQGLAGLGRDSHWQVYLPALVLSIAGMVPMMIQAERKGRARQMFLLAIAFFAVALATMGLTHSSLVLYLAMWIFFVGFNYLEANLPSLVSKAVNPLSKGTALGMFSTWQFMGAFAGGAAGGWLLEQWGVAAIVAVCLLLAALWLLLSVPASVTNPTAATAAAE